MPRSCCAFKTIQLRMRQTELNSVKRCVNILNMAYRTIELSREPS